MLGVAERMQHSPDGWKQKTAGVASGHLIIDFELAARALRVLKNR